MSTDILKKIRRRKNKHQKLLSQLLDMKKMVRGSFCLIHVKCGSKNCRCSKGVLHPHLRMSWHERGKSFSRAVPKDDYDWIQEMTNIFRKYKKLRREVVKLEKEMKILLDQYEVEIVNRSRKGKPYLEVWND